jgi:hypothetical protein
VRNLQRSSAYLQLRVAAGNVLPRTEPLLLIVAGLAVKLTQVAVMVLAAWADTLFKLTSFGSEVDHIPLESGIIGHLPETLNDTENVA